MKWIRAWMMPWSMKGRILFHHMVTIGLVLFAFSLALSILAGNYLDHQVNDGLEAAAIMLEAAMEPTPDGLEWEPNQLPILIREAPLRGRVVWLVQDLQGNVVGNSGSDAVQMFHESRFDDWRGKEKITKTIELKDNFWRVISKQVRFNPNQFPNAQLANPKPDNRYNTLILHAAFNLDPVKDTRKLIVWVLSCLSIVVWLGAFAVGIWMCRKTMYPLIAASIAAEAIQTPGFHERIHSTGTGDELDRLIQSFNGLLRRLEHSHEKQRRFTGDASHQLRTPLASIMGQIEVALRRTREPEEYIRVLGGLGRQAKQMHQIVESLLFLVRANGEEMEGQQESIELFLWAQKHLESWEAHPRFGDITLSRIGVGPTWVLANSAHLANLVMILLDNALKYSQAGTPVEIVIGVATESERTGTGHERKGSFILVRDHGMGFEEADRNRIFEPFYRAPESRRLGISGLGLGLALAMRLAEAIGATLHATSPQDGGACLEIRFPEVSV